MPLSLDMIKGSLEVLVKCLRPNISCLAYYHSSRAFRRNPRRILEPETSENTAKQHSELKYNARDLRSDPTASRYLLNEYKSAVTSEHPELIDEATNYRRQKQTVSKINTKSVNVNASKRRKQKESEDKVEITENGIEWSHLPENDKDFLNLMADLKSRSKRDKLNKILLEGRRLITEALLAGLRLNALYFVDEKELDKMPLLNGECKFRKISPTRMEAWSDLDTPPGIIAIVDKPSVEFIQSRQAHSCISLTVILDNLRDPGNVGSLIRSLSAVGCQKVVAIKGCCDVWESKVLRGGMGAHFSVPIFEKIQWEYIQNYLPHEFSVYLADSNSYEVMFEAESYKHDAASVDHEDDENENKINLVTFEEQEDGSKVILDRELKKPNPKYSKNRLPVFEHYAIDFGRAEHIVLIVGSETGGVSSAAYQFVHRHKGQRCHVPMVNNVNSLNVSTAASIIAFEIRRQLIEKKLRQRQPTELLETDYSSNENRSDRLNG